MTIQFVVNTTRKTHFGHEDGCKSTASLRGKCSPANEEISSEGARKLG